MDQDELLSRITVDPSIFGGKPIIRGRRLAVEHVLGMLAAGDSSETILAGYPWLEPEDIQACLVYAHRLVGHERVEPLLQATGTRGSSSTPASGAVLERNWSEPAATSSGEASGTKTPETRRCWPAPTTREGCW